jgi:hypothetical protein
VVVRLRHWHWLGVAVWTRPTAWVVVLDVCRCRLARARLRQNGALQVFIWGVAVRGGVGSRLEGEREGWRAPEGSWRPPLSTCVS